MAVVCLRQLSPRQRRAIERDAHELPRIALSIATQAMHGELALDLDSARAKRFAKHVAELGPGAWPALMPVLEGIVGTPVADTDARVIESQDVARISRALGRAPAKSDEIADILHAPTLAQMALNVRKLFSDAARTKGVILLLGRTPRIRATRKSASGKAAHKKRPSRPDAAGPLRDVSQRVDERVINGSLHRDGHGLRSPAAAERRATFYDLADVLFDRSKRLCAPGVVTIRDLFLLWASPRYARTGTQRVASLVLASISEAIGRGGPAAGPAQSALLEGIAELEEFFFETFEESDAPTRAAIALVTARLGFAQRVVLAGLEGTARSLVRAAYANESAVYGTLLDDLRESLLA